MNATRTIKPFDLGEVVATRGALAAMEAAGQHPLTFLFRHLSGDWGEVCADDWALNDESLESGDRLLSAYRTNKGERIWVISESDRSVTTLLLPDEY
ncbi:MAG: hypothetical protein WCS52_00975 [bacterium]